MARDIPEERWSASYAIPFLSQSTNKTMLGKDGPITSSGQSSPLNIRYIGLAAPSAFGRKESDDRGSKIAVKWNAQSITKLTC